MRQLAATTYWRAAGVVPELPYGAFRNQVAPRGYAALETAIARMKLGERDVLWPGECRFFVTSAGTSTGQRKLLPATEALLDHYRQASRDALLFYTARIGHAGVVRGRSLFLTGSTALDPVDAAHPDCGYVGEWPAIVMLNLPHWLEHHVYEPGPEIGALKDWQAKIDATIARTARCDVSLMVGIPPWVLGFVETLRAKRAHEGVPIENLEALWPNLECYVHGGMPVGPYQAELRALLGPGVNLHEIYAAAEVFVAAQDTAASSELRLMTGAGVFYEFVPLAEFDEAKPETCGPRAVPLADVKVGVDYVMLVTTPAGLARYVVGDVVRFSSLQPPRLECVGRTGLQLRTFGERVLDKDVTDALGQVCQRHRWNIVNFHVAPLAGANLTGGARGRHEWWIELKPGTVETPTGPQMGLELDRELQRLNASYAAQRTNGRIDTPTVRLVMPGVFRHWLTFHHLWGGQNKLPRCRSDRNIADELAQITRFAHDE